MKLDEIYLANITGSRQIMYLNEFIVEHDLVTQDMGKVLSYW